MSTANGRLGTWLKVSGAVYAAGAAAFTARPGDTIRTLSITGEPLEPEPAGVYTSLSSAYMATIAALSFTGAAHPDARKHVIPGLLVAKATSSAGLLVRYLQTRKMGFAVGAGVDALLLGVTAGLYAASNDR